MKTSRIALLAAVSIAVFSLSSCSEAENPSSTDENSGFSGIELRGEAQGTTYSIKYLGTEKNYKQEIDSILSAFDQDLSLWVPGSTINQINAHNRRDTVFAFVDDNKYFSVIFDRSREIYAITDGAFDPSVYPLVEAWGFGLKNKADITPELIDSIMPNVGFTEFDIDMIEKYENEYFYTETNIWKGNPNVKLDFNGIAQGYSVDMIAEFLMSEDIRDFMVELGGEVYAHGRNHLGEKWKIAIDKPLENSAEREFEAIIPLDNQAVATSGSYRKFYEENGKKYSHTINPKTGYPVDHNLLSATVIAPDCASADAFATAFMVLGVEGTLDFLNLYPELALEVYLIYDDGEQFQSLVTEHLASELGIVAEEEEQ